MLEQEVRRDGVHADAERHDDVVQVPQAAGGEHDRAIAAERAGPRWLGQQRPMHGRGDEQRIDPRPALVGDAAVLDEHQPRPATHARARRGTETRQRVAQALLPVAIGLQPERGAARRGGEVRDQIVDGPGPEAGGERARLRVGQAGPGIVAADEDRQAELDPRPHGSGALRGRPWAEDDARREVLDLALAVDRRVRHDGDGLLQVIGEVDALARERRERAVVAERADRLAGGLRHVGDRAEILGLVAERGEPLLAQDRVVLELVGRRGDLEPAVLPQSAPRSAGFAAPVGARGPRPCAREGPTRFQAVTGAVERDRVASARPEEALADRGLVEEPPAAAGALQRRVLPGAERPRVGDVALERDEAALTREDVLLVGLDVPQRAEPHGIDAEEANVAEARQERRGSLRERPQGRAPVRVGILQRLGHPADLVHDRREDELHRLDRVEPEVVDEPPQQRVDILGVAPLPRQRHAERTALLAQTPDRVDLAVVRERGEGLDALERARRVGRVAVVPEGDRRAEERVREIGEVVRQLLRGTAKLVDRGRARQAHDRRGRPRLDVHRGGVQRPVAAPPLRMGLERELPEARLLEPAARSERAGVRRVVPLEEDPDPLRGEDPAHRLVRGIGRIGGQEEVRDGETRIERRRAGDALGGESLGPERAGQVHQDAGPVALAVDLAGPVRHPLEAAEHAGQWSGRGLGVLPRDRDERAGIALVVHAYLAVHGLLLPLVYEKGLPFERPVLRCPVSAPRD